ncbi:RNA polymerase II Elongator subunit, putative [Talaromyces stipitatus ATCC 10500]|uniref:Elongator complex protein 2 n=1 Tax=Talaromyces stipitatus (strain ATCC 10500 / CBS 375.48 / QM 6759 / NRRL 1006) TaxID=441959 RepID=B8MSR0_TALSN|nr:RNA polymerase II Elongator subunit, putative [Talaromyces stipitatus ATCC 10500]EED12518.1 RNA polymerase II Elongator subunit, putative [Talaromyces stipitatus ATCC 10500]
MVRVATEYISVGGNRHAGAADWDVRSGVFAYGADNNVALWEPKSHRGVHALLVGHRDKVSVVRFVAYPQFKSSLLITGSVDHSIRVWKPVEQSSSYTCVCELTGHTGSVNTIGVDNGSNVFASGAADGTVRVWRLDFQDGQVSGRLVQTMPMIPRFFPLTLAIQVLDASDPKKPMVMAVGGTTNNVYVFSAQDTTAQEIDFIRSAKLSGHEAWVRSLAFRKFDNEYILASASQDKYIRLWKVHRGEIASTLPKDEDDMALGGDEPTLSNKAHTFSASGVTYSITFEALLLGHEDWIYTVNWSPTTEKAQLLSASADNSLTIWEQDPTTGVWVTMERMGEFSVTKGSTTATGSTGGFWIGLWSPDGKEVVCLTRTGSWRAWTHDEETDIWQQRLGISGHVRSVNDIQWEAKGAYLLSTSSDQTSRLHAEWLRFGESSWHEFSRPQIHGYDLNCIDTLGPARFISGADEKLLRVFNEPKQIAQLLERLCGISQDEEELPEAANIPVLGLSNKAVGEDITLTDDQLGGQGADQREQQAAPVSLPMHQPPLEDHLARHTLWPEHEKLYGHGYEISAVSVSHDRSLIATACKASSIDHAVIRLYDTKNWREIKPSLTAHSLTITSLCFSPSDQYLLSVGRDRQWAIFKRDEQDPSTYSLLKSNPKAHSRMILGAAWAPSSGQQSIFATAGRDKCVKIWRETASSDVFECISTITLKTAVTAVSFHSEILSDGFLLAIGEETGQISVQKVATDSLEAKELVTFDTTSSPSKSITQITWRPKRSLTFKNNGDEEGVLLAVASEDSSVRIYRVAHV